MGKNNGNSWLNAVKKAFRSPVKDDEKKSSRRREENEQEEEEKKRGKRRWIFRKPFPLETTIQQNVAKGVDSPAFACTNNTMREEIWLARSPKLDNSVVSGQRRAVAVEIIRLTRRFPVLTRENEAALVIQAIFRGYLARRALLALKGVVKLQALIRGHNVRKRAKMTLQCIQSLVRVQDQVCDQRRRLSCEAMSLGPMFNHSKTSRNSTSRIESYTGNDLDLSRCTLEEIQDLIEKAKECSLRQGMRLAQALRQQMRGSDESRFSDNNEEEFNEECSGKRASHRWVRNDTNLCIEGDPIKTVEIDTSRPYSFKSLNFHKLRNQPQFHHYHEQYLDSYFTPSPLLKKHQNLSVCSPKTPCSSKIRSIQAHSSSPRCQTETPNLRSKYSHRMSISENSCHGPQPNYMAATASATARVRSLSAPRQRPSTPSREQTGSAKKRLSFPVPDCR